MKGVMQQDDAKAALTAAYETALLVGQLAKSGGRGKVAHDFRTVDVALSVIEMCLQRAASF
jgi:hypothetical protein